MWSVWRVLEESVQLLLKDVGRTEFREALEMFWQEMVKVCEDGDECVWG